MALVYGVFCRWWNINWRWQDIWDYRWLILKAGG